MGRVTQLLLAVVILAAGVGFTFWLGIPLYQKAKASESWPEAEGKIEASRVTHDVDQKGKMRYSPSVMYTYQVQGKLHSSTHIWASGGSTSTSASGPTEVVQRYPVGATVKVFYNPADHDYAVLEPGVTGTNYFVLGVGIILLLVGGVMAVHGVLRFLTGR